MKVLICFTFVKFSNNTIKFLISERSQELSNECSESVHGDEALTILVVDPEGILEFSLHGVNVRILHQELGAQLTELSELNLTRTILINLSQNIHQLFLAWSEAHGSENLIKIICRQEILLLGIKQVEAVLQTLDLVHLESCCLVDFIEVDARVWIWFTRHDERMRTDAGDLSVLTTLTPQQLQSGDSFC